MRTVTWLLVLLAIATIAQAEPGTGTVVVSCNEADASLLVDGVLLPERTPAVLTLPTGTHTIEARKPSLVSDKKVIQVSDQQTVKVRLDLLPPAPPPQPEAAGSASGSGAGSATGSGAGSATGSGAGSAAPPPIVLPASAPAPSRCTEGGHEVACVQGPHCTEGGRPVPCKKGEALPPALAPHPPPPPAAVSGISAGSGAGSATREPAPAVAPGAAALEIATTVPHAVVYIDGAPVRDAPCVLEIEPGEHVVGVVAAGMVPAETLVRVSASPAQRQRVELSPTTPRRRIDVPAH